MNQTDKCCGTCRWNSHDGQDFICVNGDSDNCADYTEYDQSCDGWEAKQ